MQHLKSDAENEVFQYQSNADILQPYKCSQAEQEYFECRNELVIDRKKEE